jgi:heme iron utilization protein
MGKKFQAIPQQTQKGNVAVPRRLEALNAAEAFAVLATNNNGQPYTSLISYALTPDGKKIVFATPRKTSKYKNIIRSERVALLIDNRSPQGKKFLATEAVTVIGKARPVRKGKAWKELAEIFLTKHPGLDEFLHSSTTALVAVEIIQCIHVGHFQTVSVWNCT